MKFSVGLPKDNREFVNYIISKKEHIHEAYFSWGDFPSGRSSQTYSDTTYPWELMSRQTEDLKKLSAAGIPLNILFNANCYGRKSMSKDFFCSVGQTVEYIHEKYGLSSVTTTSPLVAKFIKSNFDDLEVRASVNMEIGTIEGMAYVSENFDGFYIKRELNRDFESIKKMYLWAQNNGKKLYMLANSGCLNFCSAHIFHDNLVAHESEISKYNNAYKFEGICHSFLKNKENIMKLPQITNFVRPENIDSYEPYFISAKLATRVHSNPINVLESYINRKYVGDILKILEPSHNIYPYVLENGDPLKIIKIDEIY